MDHGRRTFDKNGLMPDQRRNLAYALYKLEGNLHVDSELPSGFGHHVKVLVVICVR